MPGLGDLFGKGSIVEQLFIWGVLNQVIGALASPFFETLTQEANGIHPAAIRSPDALAQLVARGFVDREAAVAEARRSGLDEDKFTAVLDAAVPYLPPADLAQMVVRHFMTRDQAYLEAAKSGVDNDRFDFLVDVAADAPGPGDLAVALRRGLIPEDSEGAGSVSFAQGIREGRLADKYIPMIKDLAVQWPTPTDALQAELEGQLPHAEALALFEKLGGDPQFYTWLFNTRGEAPTPNEALTLLNRGIIPERGTGPNSVSYEQAFREGPWRNKWLEPFLALREYVTPPRSVVAMIHNGTLSDSDAAAELAKSGLDPKLAAAYIAEGHTRAATTERQLTQTAVIELYSNRIIAQADAHNLLTALGYSADNATLLTELADLRRSIAAVNTAVSRVHTLYVSHKITRDSAIAVLNALAVPHDQVTDIIATWDLEAAVTVRQLTEAQIVNAWFMKVISQDEAMAELQAISYTAYDAWVLLSIRAKGPLPGKPAKGANPVGPVP